VTTTAAAPAAAAQAAASAVAATRTDEVEGTAPTNKKKGRSRGGKKLTRGEKEQRRKARSNKEQGDCGDSGVVPVTSV
jgi:hypothetical protein